jgi:hypothetical protein
MQNTFFSSFDEQFMKKCHFFSRKALGISRPCTFCGRGRFSRQGNEKRMQKNAYRVMVSLAKREKMTSSDKMKMSDKSVPKWNAKQDLHTH